MTHGYGASTVYETIHQRGSTMDSISAWQTPQT